MPFAVLFDNDGTLSDSVPAAHAATNQALADEGLPPCRIEEVVDGMRFETILRMMRHAATDDRSLGGRLAEGYYRRTEPLLREIPLFPGVVDLVAALHKEGILLGIVSNNHSDIVRAVMDTGGIGNLFSVIIGEDNAEETKPAPGGLLQACRILGAAPSEVVYIGDSASDSRAARAAGIMSIGVRWNHHDPVGVDGLGFHALVEGPGELRRLIDRRRGGVPSETTN